MKVKYKGKTEYYNKLHFTYLAGNNAAFDHDIDNETADLALENLKEVTFQIFSKAHNFDDMQKRTFEYVSRVEYAITEAKTRELYIDTNLKSAGYSVLKEKGNFKSQRLSTLEFESECR